MLRVLLLDMDGTMVEQATTTRFLQHACHKLGLPVTAAQINLVQRTVGSWIEDKGDARLRSRDGFLDLNARFLTALGVRTDVDRLAREMQVIWDHFPDEMDELIYPDVRPNLEAFRRRGLTLAVVSHRHHALAAASLTHHQMTDVFTGIVSPLLAGAPRGKLDPRLWQYALHVVGAEHSEVVHVDNEYEVGIRGAQQAGIRAIFIDRTGTAPHPAGTEVVRNFDELQTLLRA